MRRIGEPAASLFCIACIIVLVLYFAGIVVASQFHHHAPVVFA